MVHSLNLQMLSEIEPEEETEKEETGEPSPIERNPAEAQSVLEPTSVTVQSPSNGGLESYLVPEQFKSQ